MSVQVQPDGKIVVAGISSDGAGCDFALVRYNADGSLDVTFGGGTGKVVTPVGSSDDSGYSVQLQPDGKIVVAGYSSNGATTTSRWCATTPTARSTRRSTAAGKVVTPVGSSAMRYSVQVQPDGKIVVAGYSYNGSNDDFALVRYNADGVARHAFGGGTGKVVTPLGSS